MSRFANFELRAGVKIPAFFTLAKNLFMAYKGQTGTSMTSFKIKDKRPLGKWNKLTKNQQKQRLQKEDELYEMVQLPNGDFKKQKRKL